MLLFLLQPVICEVDVTSA